MPRASGNEHFLLPSQYGKATKPVLVTCGPSRPYFRGFVFCVWGWSFPITISIWNNGETRFGDLRALQTLFSRFGTITTSFFVYSAKPVLVTCGPSRLYFRGSARASGDGHFLLPSQYRIAAKPALVTCGPSRPYFRGLARASGDRHFQLPSHFLYIRRTRIGDLRAVQTLFSRFGKGVWDGHFLLPSQYGIAAKPVLVTCGPSRLYFKGFGDVDKGGWGWSFPITISI